MKTYIILLFALCFIAGAGEAQNSPLNPHAGPDYRDLIQLGVKLGANYSTLYDLKGEGFSTSPVFMGASGVFVGVPFGKRFGFQPEILIVQKGFNASVTIPGGPYEFKRRTTFVDIPFLFSIKPSRNLNILVGPQYSYLVKETDISASKYVSTEQQGAFSNPDVRLSYLGITGGIDFGFSHIVLSTRVGFDVTDNNGAGTATSPRYKNIWYQATIGYRLVNH